MKKRNGFAIIVAIVLLILIGNFVGMQNNSIVKKNTPESEKTSEINTTIKEETPVSSTSETVTHKTDSDRTTYSTTHSGQNYDYKSKTYKSSNSNSVKTYDLMMFKILMIQTISQRNGQKNLEMETMMTDTMMLMITGKTKQSNR